MEIDFSQEHQTLEAREDEFRGKHVVVIDTEIYPIEDGEQATQLLEHLRKQHPGKIPLLAYVMKGEAVYPSQVLFHKTDIDFSGGVRQGLRSSPWLSLQSPRWG